MVVVGSELPETPEDPICLDGAVSLPDGAPADGVGGVKGAAGAEWPGSVCPPGEGCAPAGPAGPDCPGGPALPADSVDSVPPMLMLGSSGVDRAEYSGKPDGGVVHGCMVP